MTVKKFENNGQNRQNLNITGIKNHARNRNNSIER